MDLFKDKTYEDMDEITQMVEPFESRINLELSQFPDEFNVDAQFLSMLVSYNNHRLGYNNSIGEDLRKIVERKASELGLELLADTARTNRSFIEEFFELDIAEDTVYDATTNMLSGGILITKKKIGYEDRDLEEIMKNFLISEFHNKFYTPSEVNKGRINEILDLFNVKDGMADRKAMGKVRKLIKHYQSIVDDRSLLIKDIELFKRFVGWNIKYIKDGSLPSFSNITKVKIMMRKGLPIYSIKEDIV